MSWISLVILIYIYGVSSSCGVWEGSGADQRREENQSGATVQVQERDWLSVSWGNPHWTKGDLVHQERDMELTSSEMQRSQMDTACFLYNLTSSSWAKCNCFPPCLCSDYMSASSRAQRLLGWSSDQPVSIQGRRVHRVSHRLHHGWPGLRYLWSRWQVVTWPAHM